MNGAYYLDRKGEHHHYPGQNPEMWLRQMDADRALPPINMRFTGRQTFYSSPGNAESLGDMRARLDALLP